MNRPPTPAPTNPNDHAPGISQTLEDSAERSKHVQDEERTKKDERDQAESARSAELEG